MQCIDCHYSLMGNSSGRCPECGRTFDPADASTYVSDRQASGRGDAIMLGCTGVYAAFNFILMIMYGKSLLGPLPLALPFIFMLASGIGLIGAYPARLALDRFGATWRGAAGSAVLFAILILFNCWVVMSALSV